MKVLIFLKKWEGGVGTVVKSIKRELESRGHEVVCISREGDWKCFSMKNLFWLRKRYIEVIERKTPDVIYTQDWSMALPLVLPYRLYKDKHFCCFHGNQPGFSKIFQNFVGWTMKKKLVVVGDSLKKRFAHANMIYNGVDIKLFRPNKKIKKIKNSVGFVNWKTKDYHYEEIRSACNNLGKKFVVAGGIPYEKMPEFYQKLECFISLPPECTGFNLSWIEAMACGVPKIVGNDAGIGKRLKISKVKDDIEKGIICAKEKDYREEVKKMGFSWDNHVNKLTRIWNERQVC